MNTESNVSRSMSGCLHKETTIQKTAIAVAIGLCIATGTAWAGKIVVGPAGTTDRANVTQLDSAGGGGGQLFPGGGMNNVVFNWDGTAFNSSTDYTGLTSVSNVTFSTTATANSFLWTAHAVQMFAPGSYTFNVANPDGGTNNNETGNLVLNVGSGQLGMHLLLDWGATSTNMPCGAATCNMDIAMVFESNRVFGSGKGTFENPSSCTSAPLSNCLFNSGPASSFAGGTTANRPAGNHVWMLASVDGNGDGIPGIPMAAGGPFQYFNFNLNADLLLTDTVNEFDALGQYDGISLVKMRSAPTSRFATTKVASAIIAAAVTGNAPLELIRQGNQVTRITMMNTTSRGNVVKLVYDGFTETVTVQTVGGCLPYTFVGPTAGCAPPYGDGNGFSTSDPGNAPEFARAAAVALVAGRNITYAPFCWVGGCGEPQKVNILPLP